MSLQDKLNRYKVHMKHERPAPPARQAEEIPFLERWGKLQAKPFVIGDEYVMIREVRYPASQRHGLYAFGQLNDIIAAWEQSRIAHPLSSARLEAGDLLFFDTETTGLHGGVGNTVFLLGYCRLEGDNVVVRQHFLAAPHAETALYHSFLSAIQPAKYLVTFNGKAFDWPQVKTRHTLIRHQVPDLPGFGHYDLLHGARRLWKQELDSCRMARIEREKLGIERKKDIPGHMAPILYFDYLASKNPDTIQEVLRHNEQDVLSLITLYIHISNLLLECEEEAVTPEERFEIARWYETLGLDDCAISRFKKIAASGHSLSTRAKIALGHLYKKQKNWAQALSVWEDVVRDSAYVPEEVYIELAKLYEHQQKDEEKALYYTLRAFELWKKKASLLRHKSKAEAAAYEKRIKRLEWKIGLFSSHP